MEQIVTYLLMVQKFLNLKQKAIPLLLGNISKEFSVDNRKKTGLNGYVYDFSVDYEAIAVDVVNKKEWYKKCLDLFKKCLLQQWRLFV